MGKEITCYSQVKSGRGWCQESYETESRDAGRRARILRKLGYRVYVSSMGPQITSVGRVKMSLVTIEETENANLDNLPAPDKMVRL